MTRRLRLALFGASGAGLAALLLWAVAGLHDFGHYHERYGLVLNQVAVGERHTTNVVTAIVFDYRGFDTLGEEFILFASVIGVALLLRDVREPGGRRRDRMTSDPVGLVGIGFAVAVFMIGLYVVAHGPITPGGGFQGGVVLAAAFALAYLAGEYRAYRALTPQPALDFAEGVGAGGYAVVGIASMLLGSAFLHNFGPLGTAGTLTSGGSIPLLNLAVAIEVTGAFVLLFTEFLEELSEKRGAPSE
jgi:multicomponent Na+:H+ antiporter subunit B